MRRLPGARWILKQVQDDGDGSVMSGMAPFSYSCVTLNLFQGPFGHTLHTMRQERQPCAYILASQPCGTLYIGVTSDLVARLWQHRSNALPGFTARHHVHRLVHFELFDDMEHAIAREKQLKNWRRQWKINLINAANPEWADLAVTLGLPALAPKIGHDGS